LELKLSLPKIGIAPDSYYGLAWIFNSVVHFTKEIVYVTPVGYITNSSIIFSPKEPGGNVNMSVSLRIQESLNSGDTITIFLLDYTVPAGLIPDYGGSSLGSNLTITGSMNAGVGLLTVVLLSPLAAKESLTFSLPSTVGIILPLVGVRGSRVPSVAVESILSPVVSIPFMEYTLVGSFYPSVLRINYTDRVSLQQSIKVRVSVRFRFMVRRYTYPNLNLNPLTLTLTQSPDPNPNPLGFELYLAVYGGVHFEPIGSDCYITAEYTRRNRNGISRIQPGK
jgi:hypothetical protein